MAARRENGTPSAHTVLEVADGLRWTDPALGVSLAEHARRLAGDDDPVTRAAAERSILRSLAEADRHDEVVHRAGPLLDEARRRGDRDDAAAVVVELASAVTGLGDGQAAWALVDRLHPVDDLPARVAAAAALVRTRVRAEDGDVVGADGEAERAAAALFRVPEPEAGLLRREMACARGRARRRAGDLAGALAVLATATTDRPDDDPDGGRRSLAAAAEQIEVLAALGRADEARARAAEVVPQGPVEPALLRAVSRIRLVVAETGGGDAAVTREAAQALEDAGHLDDAARAWQVVAASAESRGDLGEALAALRHGHALDSRARDEHGRSLRRVAAVNVEHLPVADRAPVTTASVTPAPVAPGPGTPAAEPASEFPPHDDALETLPRRRGHHRNEESPAEAAPVEAAPVEAAPVEAARVEAAPVSSDPLTTTADSAPSPVPSYDEGSGLGRQDELADLLAALSRSMEQLPGPALGENGVGPAPVGPGPRESSPVDPDPLGVLATDTDPLTNGNRQAESLRDWPDAADEHGSATGRRSRHSAPADALEPDDEGAAPAATRPTFDAFSTAPLHRPEPTPAADPARERSVSELLMAEAGSPELSTPELATPGHLTPGSTSRDASSPPSDGLSEASASSGRFAPVPDALERDRLDVPRGDAGPVSPVPAVDVSPTPMQEPTPTADDPASVDRGWDAARSSSSTPDAGRPEEPRAPRTSSRPRPAPREGSRGDRDARPVNGRADPGEPVGGRTSRGTTGTSTPDELQEDLGLTLASVLGEYDLPDVPMPPRTDRQRPSASVAVPSARRHTSGSMPVPAEGRRDARNGTGEPSAPAATSAPRPSAAGGRGRPAESGPRLADLLAEAMDAFRHAGPAAQDEARPPGVGSRRA